MRKKTHTEPKKGKSYWKLTFGSSLETASTHKNADMHSLCSSDHCGDEDVDSLENELWPILLDIDATSKETDFVLLKFEGTTEGVPFSRAAAPIYYAGHILKVYEKEYKIKFLCRTRGGQFVYPKINDIVHVHEKDMEVILYINKQAKTMAHQSNIVHFFHPSKLFPQLIIK